jgi:hypothetical protein
MRCTRLNLERLEGRSLLSATLPTIPSIAAIAPDVTPLTVDAAGFAATGATKVSGQINIDADGGSDVIWRSTSGVYVAWISGDSSNARVLGGGGGWSLEAVGDLDNNGVSDLIWRLNTSGANVVWLMNADGGGGILSSTVLGGSTRWRIEATGDYNNDLNTDLVWRDSVSGANVMWLMNGAKTASSSAIGGDAGWRLVSADEAFDANGDGKTDCIWRNSAGVCVLNIMNGSSVTESRAIGGNATWSVVSATDIDMDGCGDLLWRESATGSIVQRLMTSTGDIKQAAAIGGNSQWSLVNTYGFTFLETRLVFWRNGTSGAVVAKYFLNGDYPADGNAIGGSQGWTLLARPGRQ